MNPCALDRCAAVPSSGPPHVTRRVAASLGGAAPQSWSRPHSCASSRPSPSQRERHPWALVHSPATSTVARLTVPRTPPPPPNLVLRPSRGPSHGPRWRPTTPLFGRPFPLLGRPLPRLQRRPPRPLSGPAVWSAPTLISPHHGAPSLPFPPFNAPLPPTPHFPTLYSSSSCWSRSTCPSFTLPPHLRCRAPAAHLWPSSRPLSGRGALPPMPPPASPPAPVAATLGRPIHPHPHHRRRGRRLGRATAAGRSSRPKRRLRRAAHAGWAGRHPGRRPTTRLPRCHRQSRHLIRGAPSRRCSRSLRCRCHTMARRRRRTGSPGHHCRHRAGAPPPQAGTHVPCRCRRRPAALVRPCMGVSPPNLILTQVPPRGRCPHSGPPWR